MHENLFLHTNCYHWNAERYFKVGKKYSQSNQEKGLNRNEQSPNECASLQITNTHSNFLYEQLKKDSYVNQAIDFLCLKLKK